MSRENATIRAKPGAGKGFQSAPGSMSRENSCRLGCGWEVGSFNPLPAR